MGEDHGRNRYSDNNEITYLGNSTNYGIFESPNSDFNCSNAAQGQGDGRGKKPQVEGHKIEYHLKSNIHKNKITAQGASDVGIFNFHNFEGIVHNIYENDITADRSTKVGLENFGNYNCKTSSTKDHGKAAGGSSSAQGQGGGGGKKPKGDGRNISGNDIKGQGRRHGKAYHNFSNFECNLKTTNTEDGGSTNKSIISKNEIIAQNESSYVGMFNFHNVYVDWSNAGQGQGGCEGNKGFLKRKGISHNICKNTIKAVNSRNVGIQNFGNIKNNCEPTIIS